MKNYSVLSVLLCALYCIPVFSSTKQEKCRSTGKLLRLGATAGIAYLCLGSAATSLWSGAQGTADAITGNTHVRCNFRPTPFVFGCFKEEYGNNSKQPIDMVPVNLLWGTCTGFFGYVATVSCRRQVQQLKNH